MNELFKKINSNATVKNFVTKLLDKIDRTGSIPSVFSCKREDCPEPEQISIFFGHAWVSINKKSIKLKLKKLMTEQPLIVEQLYSGLKRTQQNVPEQKNTLSAKVVTTLENELARAKSSVYQSYLISEINAAKNCRGKLFLLAHKDGLVKLEKLVLKLGKGFNALKEIDEPLRLSRFGLLVANDTKCCRLDTNLLRQFAEIIYLHNQNIKDQVDMHEPKSASERLRLILNHTKLQLDGSASQILIYGNIIFSKQNKIFDYIAKHSSMNESVVISAIQLKDVEYIDVPETLVSIENEVSFYDYIAKADPTKEGVICSMGQANQLMVSFLKTLSEQVSNFYHWGDIDRSGVLILESLRDRTNIDIKPKYMDKDTLHKHIQKARELPETELELLKKLLIKRPKIICNDLLKEMIITKSWLEQENICP